MDVRAVTKNVNKNSGKEMNQKKLGITDVVLRDAHQSLLATRMRIEDMLPIAPKLPRKAGRGQLYITAKNVPPPTMASDGGSINGDTPPPSNMASTIIPTAPIKPITDAKSIFYLTLLKKQIARQSSNIHTKPDRQRVSAAPTNP